MDHKLLILSLYTAVLIFLIYKYYNSTTYFNNEINKINTNLQELNSLIVLNNKKQELKENIENIDTGVSQSTTNVLRDEYDNYVKNSNFEDTFESDLPSELKENIDNLDMDLEDFNDELNNNSTINVEHEHEHEEQSLENTDYNDYNQYNEQSSLINEDNLQSNNVEEEVTMFNDVVNEINEINEPKNVFNGVVDEINKINEPKSMFNGVIDEINEMNNPDSVCDVTVETVEEHEIVGTLEADESMVSIETNEVVEINTGEQPEEPDSDIVNIKTININDTEIKSYKNYTLDDIDNLTIKQLQNIARENKLKIKGKKDELIERVKTLYNFNLNLN